MLRLSRARVIGDIELLVNSPGPARGQRKLKGAECSVDRHSYAGEAYGFHSDVLHIRMPATGRLLWKLILVSEIWRRGDTETMHSTKWLKLMSGKPTEVLKWISANRDPMA